MMKQNLLFSFLCIFCGLLSVSGQERYNTLVHKGNKEFDRKNYESASSQYMAALEHNQKDFTAHYNLGNALYKRKMYEEAQAEYEKAEQLAGTLSDKSAALYNLGNTYMQREDSKKAAELYKQALKQDPYNENIRRNYEIAMLREKEKQQQQQDQSGEGGKDQNKDQKQGNEPGDNPQQQEGKGNQNKGEGEGNDKNQGKSDANKMPKELEDAILNRVENKERETARRILNKNSYSMPESNEKDW